MDSCANAIVYFDGEIIRDSNDGVIFRCEDPAYFSIPYDISFLDLKNELCGYINGDTRKEVQKIRHRCPLSVFGGLVKYQAVLVSDDNCVRHMFMIHQQHQSNIPIIELYVEFKEVALPLYHQNGNEIDQNASSERGLGMEINNSVDDFEGELRSGQDDANDDIDANCSNNENVSKAQVDQNPHNGLRSMQTIDQFQANANRGCCDKFHIGRKIQVLPDRVLFARRAGVPIPHPALEFHLRTAGFWEVSQLSHHIFDFDSALISALVERWHPETHTFHLPYGEATITLEDVALLLGLRVDGPAVTGVAGGWSQTLGRDVWELAEELLGRPVPVEHRKASTLKLSWLRDAFPETEIVPDMDPQVLMQYARAYILRLIGGYLLTDKSSARVPLKYLLLLQDFTVCGTLSWGGAVLAYLYRSLCRATKYQVTDISGCLALLLSWAYYRLPDIRSGATVREQEIDIHFPLAARWAVLKVTTHSDSQRLIWFRRMLDGISIDGFIYTPYEDMDIVSVIPEHISMQRWIRSSITSLICFEIVEWHQADRVLRQFHFRQHIPDPPLCIERLHILDARGRDGTDWVAYHAEWIRFWDQRHQRVLAGLQTTDTRPSAEYLTWWSMNPFRYLAGGPIEPEFIPDDLPTPVTLEEAHRIPQPISQPDERRVPRRARAGTRQTGREYSIGTRDTQDHFVPRVPLRPRGRSRAQPQPQSQPQPQPQLQP